MLLCCSWAKRFIRRCCHRRATQARCYGYTTVIVAGHLLQHLFEYITPYSGTAMAEEFMYNGQHALIVYDDLSKQATACRQLSLLMRRPPGREAYPVMFSMLIVVFLKDQRNFLTNTVEAHSHRYLLSKRLRAKCQHISPPT